MNKKFNNLCQRIAKGVYCLEVGKGISRSNVYFVQSNKSWVLIDTAEANNGQFIKKTAESLFGIGTKPKCILLTHDHPDHGGSAKELANIWKCKVFLHPNELPIAIYGSLKTFEKYANPLDRYIILPILRKMPKEKVQAMIKRVSLKNVCKPFDPKKGVPYLPDWKCIPCPGHTPGHIAFFRPSDKLLITGDAIVTVDLNSFFGFLLWTFHIPQKKISEPPRYSTWNLQMARKSIITLVSLNPKIIASGHGLLIEKETAKKLSLFAQNIKRKII